MPYPEPHRRRISGMAPSAYLTLDGQRKGEAMPGYTPQFRGLGTPEGEFHAEFTSSNAKTRQYARELSAAHPEHRAVQSFVAAFTTDRESLWETWKRTLPAHLRPIVLSVTDTHHGPALHESGSAEYRTFLTLVQAVARRTRRRLDDLVAAVPGDSSVSDCCSKFTAQLDALEVALDRHQKADGPR